MHSAPQIKNPAVCSAQSPDPHTLERQFEEQWSVSDPQLWSENADLPEFRKTFVHHMGEFLVSNEHHPNDARIILEAAKSGIILALGSERVLFDYIMCAENTSGEDFSETPVLAVDIDPALSRFHLLNCLLLKAVPDGELALYRRLRIAPTPEEWEQAAALAEKGRRLTETEARALLSGLEWWKTNLGESEKWALFYREPPSPDHSFAGVNYLYDQGQFCLIQQLALSDRYHSHILDIGNPQHAEKLCEHIVASGFPLAVVDISNAWEDDLWSPYLGAEKLKTFLEKLNEVASDNTLFVCTKTAPIEAPITFYHGYKFRFFRGRVGSIDDWSGKTLTWAHEVRDIALRLPHDYQSLLEAGPLGKLISA